MTKQVHILLFVLIILDLKSGSVCIVSLCNSSCPYRFVGVLLTRMLGSVAYRSTNRKTRE